MADILIQPGAVNQSVFIRFCDNTTGLPVTSVVAATAGLGIVYARPNAAAVALSVSNLSAMTDAHSDGGLLHDSQGSYRLDIPDNAWAIGVDEVKISATAT